MWETLCFVLDGRLRYGGGTHLLHRELLFLESKLILRQMGDVQVGSMKDSFAILQWPIRFVSRNDIVGRPTGGNFTHRYPSR